MEDDRIDGIVAMINQFAGEVPVLKSMLASIAGTLALSLEDPRGFLNRALDKAEQDIREGYPSEGTARALEFGLDYISDLRNEYSRLPGRTHD